MGVFDDAIREHLELKRQLGADESELQELEDEAFGQAARPGDPDFPGSTSEEEAIEPEATEPEPAAESPNATSEADALPDEEPAAAEDSGAVPFDVAAEAPPAEQPAPAPPEEDVTEPPAPAEPVAEEPPIGDEPDSEELAVPDEPEPEPEIEPESSFSTAEREAIADQPTVFFDQAPGDLELGDLELDLDEEIEEVGGAVSEPVPSDDSLGVEEVFSDEPATEVAEPPHEVEPEPEPEADEPEPEPLPDPEPETEAAEAIPAEPTEPVTSDFVSPDEDAEPGTGEDSVLEETPEFLRDNPDDDELWFEQGEPKDFDF